MASTKPITKSAWQRRNDRGPHLATLPSGAVVKFRVADLSMLLRAGKLPEPLEITASLMAEHEEGPDGYTQDLVRTAIMRGGDGQKVIAEAISLTRDLTHHLVAESLVEPQVSAEEIAEGLLPEADVRMLVELATRSRNVDAAGKKLPIIVPTEEPWATFRYHRAGPQGSGARGANGADVRGDVPDADGGEV